VDKKMRRTGGRSQKFVMQSCRAGGRRHRANISTADIGDSINDKNKPVKKTQNTTRSVRSSHHRTIRRQ